MIDFPELPDFLRVDPKADADRRKNRDRKPARWTRNMSFDQDKPKDLSTERFRAELETKAKAEAKQLKADRKEAKIVRARQCAHLAQPTTQQEMDMNAKKSPTTMAPAPKRKLDKAPKAASKAKSADKARSGKTAGIRVGSKLEIIVGLLTRKEGCTTKDVLDATGWPAVSMPQQAKAAGLTLHKEKKDGVTVYSAA